MAAGWRKLIHSSNTIADLALPTANIDANSNKIINVSNPTEDQDVATLSYVAQNSGSGARTVTGATNNGIITWVDSNNTFQAEGNFTFDDTLGLVLEPTTTTVGLTLGGGTDNLGRKLTAYGDTSGKYMEWDNANNRLQIAGVDGNTALDITDGNVVINDNLTVSSGTASFVNTTVTGNMTLGGASKTFTWGGSTFDINATSDITIDTNNTSNPIKIGTSTSGVPVNIGHSTSDVNIGDNLIVAGNLTVQGETTTINTSNLAVEDALIELAVVGTPTKTTGHEGGIVVRTSETQTNDPRIIWENPDSSTTSNFEWVMTRHADTTKIGIAGIQKGTGAPSGIDDIGGGLYYDSSAGELYYYDEN